MRPERIVWRRVGEDLRRGVAFLRRGSFGMVAAAGSQDELFRLRRQERQLERELEECYQAVGERALEALAAGRPVETDSREFNELFLEVARVERERRRVAARLEELRQVVAAAAAAEDDSEPPARPGAPP